MDRILLLMPYFMDYNQILYNELKRKYQVSLLNSDKFDRYVIENYRDHSITHKVIRKFSKRIEMYDKEIAQQKYDRMIMKKISNQKNAYQVVMCINGGYTSEWLLNRIRKLNPSARFIYYAWDDIANLFSCCHIHLFDHIYSYNIEDCKKNHWVYLPMFVQEQYIGHKPKSKYDISFIGTAHSNRIEFAAKLLKLYSHKYKIFIYLYDKGCDHSSKSFCFDQPLTYRKYLEILSESKAVIDLPAETQSGPTTRFFDALLTDTKVITTNSQILNYPVYSNNILIVDRNTLEIDDAFMSAEYQQTDYKALIPANWVKQLGL